MRMEDGGKTTEDENSRLEIGPMKVAFVLIVVGALVSAGSAPATQPPQVIEIWPGQVPDEAGDIGAERTRMSPALDRVQVEVTEPSLLVTDVSKPSLTIYRPESDNDSGTAIVICPGGGYWNLYWQLEGVEIAEWLVAHGITGIILKYRVPRRPGEPEAEPARRPLQDAQRAISLVRSKSQELGIRADRIGIIGFSAGGHLAMSSAVKFDSRSYSPIDEIDAVSCRPDFAIAVYPGYLKAKDADKVADGLGVVPNTPPTFLVHGGDDIISSPEHSVMMYLALRRAGIPTELHVYASTTHDFGVRNAERPYGGWTDACIRWLKHQGFHPMTQTGTIESSD